MSVGVGIPGFLSSKEGSLIQARSRPLNTASVLMMNSREKYEDVKS